MKYFFILILLIPTFSYAGNFYKLDSLGKGKILLIDTTAANDSVYVVQVKVVDENNKPLQGGFVELGSSDKITERKETDDKGNCTFIINKKQSADIQQITAFFYEYSTVKSPLNIAGDLYIKIELVYSGLVKVR